MDTTTGIETSHIPVCGLSWLTVLRVRVGETPGWSAQILPTRALSEQVTCHYAATLSGRGTIQQLTVAVMAHDAKHNLIHSSYKIYYVHLWGSRFYILRVQLSSDLKV